MDTDDLTDAAYAIILSARRVSGVRGAALAVSGQHSKSEREFLQRMLETLSGAREDLDDYVDDEDYNPQSAVELEETVQRLEPPLGRYSK